MAASTSAPWLVTILRKRCTNHNPRTSMSSFIRIQPPRVPAISLWQTAYFLVQPGNGGDFSSRYGPSRPRCLERVDIWWRMEPTDSSVRSGNALRWKFSCKSIELCVDRERYSTKELHVRMSVEIGTVECGTLVGCYYLCEHFCEHLMGNWRKFLNISVRKINT